MNSLYSVGKGRRAQRTSDKNALNGQEKKSPGSIRMQMDMSELSLPDNCSLSLENEQDLMQFRISIRCDSGFWKNGTFVFKFTIPENYPHKAPKVVCETPIYHPNIDINGAVCLNILKDDWRPILNTQNVVHGLIFLFLEPNPADPLNHEAAKVLRSDTNQFRRNVNISLRGGSVDGHYFARNPTF